ncbi:hypothetical protein [Arthrobacter rhizosphaerae]|uniref:hypothetical protein n=1 Tax=Arthrobacter rhizosphaerae TaxID=2855490 RepID=UPI001FF3FE58|nr:hypothetical protein [Arthrobacter rhizosphaerae]
MTNDPGQPDKTTPENIEAHTETAQPPTGGTEGEKKNADDMDLTPLGLSGEAAKEEDPESFAKPENS